MLWTPRIRFGGLIDIPDERGETRAQGPVVGFGVDLLRPGTAEPGTLNLPAAVIRGRLPARRGEALLSDELASRLGVRIGETATFIGSTRHGSFTTSNLIVPAPSGSVSPRSTAGRSSPTWRTCARPSTWPMPRGRSWATSLTDSTMMKKQAASQLSQRPPTPRTPSLRPPIRWENRAGSGTLDLYDYLTGVLLVIFIIVMSIVLWNAGLMASLRRYGEFGLRLAMGETGGGSTRRCSPSRS